MEQERIAAPAYLTGLASDKKRDSDERVRLLVVEALVLLCGTRAGRDLMRKLQLVRTHCPICER